MIEYYVCDSSICVWNTSLNTQCYHNVRKLVVRGFAGGIIIAKMADWWTKDYQHWLTKYHPLEIIYMDSDFYSPDGYSYPIVIPEYRDWCRDAYLYDGILRFRNHKKIAILEPGNFRVESWYEYSARGHRNKAVLQ